MKEKTTGKRFSKIRTITPETWDELDKLFIENGGELGQTFAGMLAEMVDNSREILRDKGLPDIPRLWWRKGFGDWQAEPLTFEECGGGSDLDHYILNTLDKPHDSPEGIAAQIIVSAHRVATWEGDSRDKEIFKLGRLVTLYKVYGIESGTNTKNSKKNRRRLWAELLADDLVENNSNATFSQLWEAIPEGENEGKRYDGYEIYRGKKDEKDGLHAGNKTKDDFITQSTFRTEYISPAQKRHREKSRAGKK